MNRELKQFLETEKSRSKSNIRTFKAVEKYKEVIAYIEDLEAQLKSKDELLLEACESIDNKYRRVELATSEELAMGGQHEKYCVFCGTENLTFKDNKHTTNCIVKKVQDYISKES